MVSEQPRIDYCPRPDTPPEEEASALASVYRFLLDRHAEKAAHHRTCPEHEGGDDGVLRTEPETAVIGEREKR